MIIKLEPRAVPKNGVLSLLCSECDTLINKGMFCILAFGDDGKITAITDDHCVCPHCEILLVAPMVFDTLEKALAITNLLRIGLPCRLDSIELKTSWSDENCEQIVREREPFLKIEQPIE